MKNFYIDNTDWSSSFEKIKGFSSCDIIFKKDLFTMVNILKDIYHYMNLNLYFRLYSVNATNIGSLLLPRLYDGQLIIPKKRESIILECDVNFFNEDHHEFLKRIFQNNSDAIITSLSPNDMQEIFYNSNIYENYKKYYDNLNAYIRFDNNNTYLNFYYDEKYENILNIIKDKYILHIDKQ